MNGVSTASETDLGWANGWTITPEIVIQCRAQFHTPADIDVGPPGRGLEHVVHCSVCRYVYRYDSGD